MNELELIVKIAGIVVGLIGIGDKVYSYAKKKLDARRRLLKKSPSVRSGRTNRLLESAFSKKEAAARPTLTYKITHPDTDHLIPWGLFKNSGLCLYVSVPMSNLSQ